MVVLEVQVWVQVWVQDGSGVCGCGVPVNSAGSGLLAPIWVGMCSE